MPEHSSDDSPVRRFFATALIVLGVLWMSASGLCSAWMLGHLLSENAAPRDLVDAMPMILAIGGFSLGLGFVVYVVGKSLRPLK
ncbi:MAG: hypothetical protein ABL973_06240 [Micropepsaceae bacterium]